MWHKPVLLAFICLLGISANSQIVDVKGLILDKETNQVIEGAHILLANGTTSVSNSKGQFTIKLDELPIILRITHVSYGQSNITIDEWSDGLLAIRLEKITSQLGEVQVSGERMSILTKDDDFSLSDFAFDHDNLWMLGNLNKNPRLGRLWLSNQFGDTIRSISIDKADSLHCDVFGNVHLFANDTAFQLYGHPDTIVVVDALSIMRFKQLISPIKEYFSDKLVYQKYLPYQEGLHSLYYSSNDSVPRFISCTRDTAGEYLQEDEYVYGYCASEVQAIALCKNPADKLGMILAMQQRRQNREYQMYRNIDAPIVGTNRNLYLLNMYKDSLLAYNSSGTFIGSKRISFHKESRLLGVDYKEIELMHDYSTDKVYCLERKIDGWFLNPLDLSSGKLLAQIPLPDYPGMIGITVQNNAVYFLYYEKNFPYFTRLYRFQI